MSAAGVERAWGWVDHLRAGGVIPWADFAGRAPTRGAHLPGAIQLELARRLNLGPPVDSRTRHSVVDEILDSSGPGRGQPDLELVGAHDGSPFGPRPVDPGDLPLQELTRLAVGLLAELVAATDPGEQASSGPGRGAFWRRGHVLRGDPLAVARTRATLNRAGLAPGRRTPDVVLLATDLSSMLADVWSWRVQHTLSPSWRAWLAGWSSRDALPRVLDLPSVATRQASLVGADRVHVVVSADPVVEGGQLLGLQNPPAASDEGLSGPALDVVRRVNTVLRVLVAPQRHQELLDGVLLPLLSDETGSRRTVPPRLQEWVRRRAERMRDELRSAGYAVVGNLDALVPGERLHQVGPAGDDVLDVALRALMKVKERAQ